MRKSILAVAVLSSLCGLAQADAISYGGDSASGTVNGTSSTIDIYQISGTTETNTDNTVTSIDLTQTGAADQINVVQGFAADNSIKITQEGGAAIANVVINATLPDAPNGLGSQTSGNIADITAATAGSVGSNNDAATADGGTSNTLVLDQTGDNVVANIGIDGSNNIFNITQASANAVLNVVSHGTNINYAIAQ